VSTHFCKSPQNQYLWKHVQRILRFYQSACIQIDRQAKKTEEFLHLLENISKNIIGLLHLTYVCELVKKVLGRETQKTDIQADLTNVCVCFFFCAARYRQLLRHVCDAGCFPRVRRRATFGHFAITHLRCDVERTQTRRPNGQVATNSIGWP
jgi:hypothetical protein